MGAGWWISHWSAAGSGALSPFLPVEKPKLPSMSSPGVPGALLLFHPVSHLFGWEVVMLPHSQWIYLVVSAGKCWEKGFSGQNLAIPSVFGTC